MLGLRTRDRHIAVRRLEGLILRHARRRSLCAAAASQKDGRWPARDCSDGAILSPRERHGGLEALVLATNGLPPGASARPRRPIDCVITNGPERKKSRRNAESGWWRRRDKDKTMASSLPFSTASAAATGISQLVPQISPRWWAYRIWTSLCSLDHGLAGASRLAAGSAGRMLRHDAPKRSSSRDAGGPVNGHPERQRRAAAPRCQPQRPDAGEQFKAGSRGSNATAAQSFAAYGLSRRRPEVPARSHNRERVTTSARASKDAARAAVSLRDARRARRAQLSRWFRTARPRRPTAWHGARDVEGANTARARCPLNSPLNTPPGRRCRWGSRPPS